jgi:hypothetical protein
LAFDIFPPLGRLFWILRFGHADGIENFFNLFFCQQLFVAGNVDDLAARSH